MDLSVQQIVLGELYEELCLGKGVDSGSWEQFLVRHLALLVGQRLLTIIRHEVGLWDLIDGLEEVYWVRLHVD